MDGRERWPRCRSTIARARAARSKYGIGRTVRVLLDLFTVKFLLRLRHAAGAPVRPDGPRLAARRARRSSRYLSYVKLVPDEAIGGRPLLMLGALLFLTGVILVSFGLLGELLVRTYHESQGKPIYVVKELRPTQRRRARRRLTRALTRVLFLDRVVPSRCWAAASSTSAGSARRLVAAGDAGDGRDAARRTPAWPARGAARRRARGARGARRARRERASTRWCPRRSRAAGACASRFDVLVVRGTRVLGLPGLLAARVLGHAGRAPARGQRRDVGRDLHLGHAAGDAARGRAPACARAVRAAQPLAARRRRVRRDVARDPRRVAARRGVAARADPATSRTASTPTRFRPAIADERAGARARGSACRPTRALVTYTGRLLRGKGLETLLDAFARLRARRADCCSWCCVGSGAGQALSVEDALRERGGRARPRAGRVTFAGRVENVAGLPARVATCSSFPSRLRGARALAASRRRPAACPASRRAPAASST